jgi:heparan-alpha-glucosaminide N-acetyltransferase
VLIMLGISLRSLGQTTTNYFFVDTLTQIGLGYFLLFLLAHATRAMQILAVVLILVAYWGLFAAWPLPAPDFDLTQVGVPPDWPYLLDGFAAHWNKNTNPAFAFDRWFMNLFPRQTPYAYDGGGYCTLNFVPTLATMLLGVIAGGFLRDFRRRQPPADGRLMSVLLIGGAGLCFVGWGLGYAGICPVVKRIWTPAWVLYSGGICFVTLGILSFVCDQRRWQAWAWPLMVIGANSITAYVMSWTMERPIMAFLHRHLGERIFLVAGEAWEPVLFGSAVLLSMWLILLWLYRQRIFVRI